MVIKRTSIPFIVWALIGLVFVGAVFFSYSAANASQETTVELVSPSNATAGSLITVKIIAHNVQNLGGFQSTVQFDPTQLHLTGATISDDLKRSGRDVMPLGPVLRDDAVVLGAVTCPARNCTDAQPQRSFLRMLSGVGGDVELGDVSFVAAVPGTYTLTLDNAQLVDSQGNRLQVRFVGTALNVSK